MNKWQERYKELIGGKVPSRGRERDEFNLLSGMKENVIVEFPDFNGVNGFKPAHTEEYIITMNDCNMPEGVISVEILASNLYLWNSRGYKISSK